MRLSCIPVLFLFIPGISFSQQSHLSMAVNKISEYISSEEFARMRDSTDHLSLVDSIFIYSLRINKNNISEALLSAAFACIPYKKFPVVIPLINLTIQIPLISADDSVFTIKNKNLPSKLFFDSPANAFGDKDKTAHFFGNAFIGYNSTFLNLGNFLGFFVEVFEETFKVQSKIDDRDMTANYYGRAFGKALKENEFVLPSQSLILHSMFYNNLQL